MEPGFDHLRDVLVMGGQDVRTPLDHGDRGSDPREELPQLRRHRARPQDQQGVRHGSQIEQFVARHIAHLFKTGDRNP